MRHGGTTGAAVRGPEEPERTVDGSERHPTSSERHPITRQRFVVPPRYSVISEQTLLESSCEPGRSVAQSALFWLDGRLGKSIGVSRRRVRTGQGERPVRDAPAGGPHLVRDAADARPRPQAGRTAPHRRGDRRPRTPPTRDAGRAAAVRGGDPSRPGGRLTEATTAPKPASGWPPRPEPRTPPQAPTWSAAVCSVRPWT